MQASRMFLVKLEGTSESLDDFYCCLKGIKVGEVCGYKLDTDLQKDYHMIILLENSGLHKDWFRDPKRAGSVLAQDCQCIIVDCNAGFDVQGIFAKEMSGLVLLAEPLDQESQNRLSTLKWKLEVGDPP